MKALHEIDRVQPSFFPITSWNEGLVLSRDQYRSWVRQYYEYLVQRYRSTPLMIVHPSQAPEFTRLLEET